MKALVHNPYWNSWGGGERYVSRFCKKLLIDKWEVDIDWKEDLSIEMEKRFGFDLCGAKYVEHFNSFDYDLVFWVSDGSLPTLFAKQNIIHLQFPFINIGGKSLFNLLKSKFYEFVVNSQFTKAFIDKEFGVSSKVLYPPIDVETFVPGKKENLILYVGRFSKLIQQKGQEVLIDNISKINSGWKLVLAGGVGVGTDEVWLKELEAKASKFGVQLVKNPRVEELRKLYGKAKIFWSASGFGINEDEDPIGVEHFGISVVEAMSSGCVPIVTNLGGHKEIIGNNEDGILWNTVEELINETNLLIKNPNRLKKLSQMAIQKSKMFSTSNFYEKIDSLVGHRRNS